MANALGATPAEKGIGPALQKGEEDQVSSPTENKAYVLEAIENRINGQVGDGGEVVVDGVTVRVDAAEGSGESPVVNAGDHPDWRLAVHRTLADADLVVTHSTVTGPEGAVDVRFDLWRLAAGKIVDHQYSQEQWQNRTASGRSQVDGPTEPDAAAPTDSARSLIEDTVQVILIDNDFSNLDQYLAGDDYLQHNHRFADGVSGLATALGELAKQGITMKYDRMRVIVAEGDFVYVLSDGHFGGAPYTFHDLFRVAGGRALEHWDVMVPA